jgi:hypothetical protein
MTNQSKIQNPYGSAGRAGAGQAGEFDKREKALERALLQVDIRARHE